MIQRLLDTLRARLPARIRQDANLKDLLRNSGILYAAGMISLALTYLQQLTTANLLGVEDYGRYAIVVSSGMLMMLIADFRTWEIGSKLLARPMGDSDHPEFIRITSWLLFLEILTGGLSTLLLILLANFIAHEFLHAPELSSLLTVFAFSLPFRTMSVGVLGVIPRFYNRFNWLAWKSIGYAVIRLILITGAAWMGFGLTGVIVGVVVGEILNTLILFFFYQRIWQQHMMPDSRRLLSLKQPLSEIGWRKLLVDQWVSSTLAGIHYQLFIPVVALLTTPVQVGVLRSGMDIADLLERAIQPITLVFSPRIIALFEQNNLREFRRYLKQVALLLIGIMLPLSGVLLISAPFILPRFYDPNEFVGLVPVAMWLVLGTGIYNSLFWWVRPALITVTGLRYNNILLTIWIVIGALGLIAFVPDYAAAGAGAVRAAFLGLYALTSYFQLKYALDQLEARSNMNLIKA